MEKKTEEIESARRFVCFEQPSIGELMADMKDTRPDKDWRDCKIKHVNYPSNEYVEVLTLPPSQPKCIIKAASARTQIRLSEKCVFLGFENEKGKSPTKSAYPV